MTVTAATVALWSKFPLPDPEDELALLELIIAAVTEHVEDHYVVADPMTDSQELAVMMQSARMWRRRDTPEGVIAFDELGAVRVTRLDPDVERMLTAQVNFA
jgi:hypothetical protein